ncbi:MAG: tRNA uridine-5-carboxymethylaminomethyl(34) synthesis GTPase MnmE [Pseudomonadota bacterium]|nr:tRNA uridine-5-carboxymethylaminomethyl(34) synthesis GTPase MnmE [Pseudomonadota bacterium]
MTYVRDTIAAVATPPGFGAVGIVRLSGPQAPEIARTMAGSLPDARQAKFARFVDAAGVPIDEGLILYFPAPHSFTGEHVVEFQGHGGPVVMDLLLARCLGLGARAARPGEFSERAFLNGKLDLTQAEAVADLIASGSVAAVRAAGASLRGEFSHRVDSLVEALTELRAYTEAALDFPDEEIDFLSSGDVAGRIADLITRIDALMATADQGRLLSEGMTVVIAGPPNAGKSSLLNRLAGEETAIVSDIPGTTRDVLKTQILIDGMPVHVVDTAGLRASDDQIEREGIRRARSAAASADALLWVTDDRLDAGDPVDYLAEMAVTIPDGSPMLWVRNKIDLTGTPPGPVSGFAANRQVLGVSARSGAGLEVLRQELRSVVGKGGSDAGIFSARRRHMDALARARRHLIAGRRQLDTAAAGELVAEELKLAQQHLGEITGKVTSDDLLGKIFSSFCIGK